jgi:hypothetical protein
MKVSRSAMILALVWMPAHITAAAMAGIRLKPVEELPADETNQLRGGARGLTWKGWGYFVMDGDEECLTKVPNPQDTDVSKVKFLPCDWYYSDRNQMWRFEGEADINCEYSGLLFNRDGGCLAVRGEIKLGKNLRVMECDNNELAQQWIADGDVLWPSSNRDLCVNAVTFPIRNRDPARLVDCDTSWSLDFYDV